MLVPLALRGMPANRSTLKWIVLPVSIAQDQRTLPNLTISMVACALQVATVHRLHQVRQLVLLVTTAQTTDRTHM